MNDLHKNPRKVQAMTWVMKKSINSKAQFVIDQD